MVTAQQSPKQSARTAPLTDNERMLLAAQEAIIERTYIAIGNALITIKENHLYREYGTWTKYLIERWGYTNASTARQYMIAARTAKKVEDAIGETPPSKNQALKINSALRPVPADQETFVLRQANAHAKLVEKPMSKLLIKRVWSMLEDAQRTGGTVDTGNGTMSALDAALDVEDYEAMMRRDAYRRERNKWDYVDQHITTLMDWQGGTFRTFMHGLNVAPDERIKVIVMREKPDEG